MSNIFGIQNGKHPPEGARALGVVLYYSTDGTGVSNPVTLPLAQVIQSGKLSIVQTVFIDNSQNPNALTLDFGPTQQIICPALSQGYFSVLATSQLPNVTVSSNPLFTEASFYVYIDFINVAIPPQVWIGTDTEDTGIDSPLVSGGTLNSVNLDAGKYAIGVSTAPSGVFGTVNFKMEAPLVLTLATFTAAGYTTVDIPQGQYNFNFVGGSGTMTVIASRISE